jgi:hypothetical protein
LKLAIENQAIKWPKIANGISSQLQNYDPTKDKVASAKLAQDIVATMSMGAYAIRSQFGFIFSKDIEEANPVQYSAEFARRVIREYPAAYRDPRRFYVPRRSRR